MVGFNLNLMLKYYLSIAVQGKVSETGVTDNVLWGWGVCVCGGGGGTPRALSVNFSHKVKSRLLKWANSLSVRTIFR